MTPEAQLRERFPRLASLVASTKVARVEHALAKRLRAAGAVTYEVGYRGKTEELTFVRIERGRRYEEHVDMNSLDLGDSPEEELETVVEDRVDAVLRILSQGLVTERAVILAFHAPPLTDAPRRLDVRALSAVEALDPTLLPDAPEPFVHRVKEALAAVAPSFTPEQLRTYIRNASVVGAIASLIGLGGWLWVHPFIAGITAPVIVICLIVASMYALELRQVR